MAAAVLGMALLGTGVIATSAEAGHIQSGDTRATAEHGSISQCPTGTTQLLLASNGGNATGGGVTATVTNAAGAPTRGGQYLTLAFASSLTGAEVTAYVKGANAYNQYLFTVAGTITGLHSPLNTKGSIPAVSHYLICQRKAPPPKPQFDTPPDLHLGYADDFHSANGATAFRPSPWNGSPDVVYVGCEGGTCGGPSGKFDSGAIRIDNVDTDTPLTLKAANVVINDCTFDPWKALLPATADPATPTLVEKIVLAQSGILGAPMPAPCSAALDPLYHGEANFDTSERSGDTRSPSFYDCNPAVRHKPVITLTFEHGIVGSTAEANADDVTLTVIDETMILNTGGTDSYACRGVDEATPWTGPIFYSLPPGA